jgi:hypothetical protein
MPHDIYFGFLFRKNIPYKSVTIRNTTFRVFLHKIDYPEKCYIFNLFFR